MSKQKVWVLLGAAVLFASLAIMQTMTARLAVAQEPNPTPTPKPTEPPPQTCTDCCGIMFSGGHTVGGPASDVVRSDASLEETIVFRSGNGSLTRSRPMNVCATVENTTSAPGIIEMRLGFGISTVSRKRLDPGQTRTICATAERLEVSCDPSSLGPCTFKWRVDKED
jgi:hypothetical protein